MDTEQSKEKFGKALSPFVSVAQRVGLSANQVSVLSFVVALAAAGSFFYATTAGFIAGVVLMVVSGTLDVVDGELARATGTASARGDMLDHTLDRFSDVALIVGVAGGLDAWMLGTFAVVGVLLTSYMGTQAQAVGAGRDYGGFLGRATRFGLLMAGGLIHPFAPSVWLFTMLEWVLVVFAVAGTATALQRFWHSWRALD